MFLNPSSDLVRQQALTTLMAQFVQQGHPEDYAKFMAISTIFQADLELRNAQIAQLLSWLQQEHPTVHDKAVQLVESTRAEFEQRVGQ